MAKNAPLYRLTAPFYHGETYFEKGETIMYEGVPNASMQPVNAEAKAVVKKHQDGEVGDTSGMTPEQKKMVDKNDQPAARKAYTVEGETPENYVPDTSFNPGAPSQVTTAIAPALADGQTRINAIDTPEEVAAAFPGLASDEDKAKAKEKADASKEQSDAEKATEAKE